MAIEVANEAHGPKLGSEGFVQPPLDFRRSIYLVYEHSLLSDHSCIPWVLMFLPLRVLLLLLVFITLLVFVNLSTIDKKFIII